MSVSKLSHGLGKVKEVVASGQEMHKRMQDVNVEPPKGKQAPDCMDVDRGSKQVKEDSDASRAEGQVAIIRRP
jgi:hypothetical protein